MDITFITMHDLSPEAVVLYASDSVTDVLGYLPQDIVGKSSFEYFHPEEAPFARSIHDRGVCLDRAAVLSYCRLKRANSSYIVCECVFTVVYDVVVACTSLYNHTPSAQGRARDAPLIRQVFSATDRDPRYHMLKHLSQKFTTPSMEVQGQHEKRAAVILNRFTRTLTVLYATNALNEILGIPPHEAEGRSFYECIHEDCLQDAVDALERAKENDSIAYLRFRWRDPRLAERRPREQGVHQFGAPENLPDGPVEEAEAAATMYRNDQDQSDEEEGYDDDAMDDRSRSDSTPQSSMSSGVGGREGNGEPIEVEAVISCTSDGLVVVLRKARTTPPVSMRVPVHNGVFASPWAHAPLVPPAGGPAGPRGPAAADFMESIRQVAVFAWSLRSINENVVQHARGCASAPDSMQSVGFTDNPQRAAYRNRFVEKELLARERAGNMYSNEGYYVGGGGHGYSR